MNEKIANDLIRYAELVEDAALISPEEMNCASLMRLAAEALAQPEHEPVTKKWILHGSFADVASFDAEGVPSFYWKESVAKFNSGQLNAPCKGKNCGSLNGWLHSAECHAEHEAQYTTPPQRKPLTDEQINARAKAEGAHNADFWAGVRFAEAEHCIKE